MAYHPTEEAPTERLIHIYLEPRPSYGGDHRHIRTAVVRRSMAHVRNSDLVIEKYWDAVAANGYRCASWSSSKENAVFVDGLTVRGQIDAYGADKLNDGKPYGNEAVFMPHRVDARDALRMANTFKFLARRSKMLEDRGHIFTYDDFSEAVRKLALSLGIKRFIVKRRGIRHAPYEDASAFVEFGFDKLVYFTEDVIDRIRD